MVLRPEIEACSTTRDCPRSTVVLTGHSDASGNEITNRSLSKARAQIIADYLHERGVAALGCDGVSDVLPSGVGGSVQPIHEVVIAHMGVHIIDNMALDRLIVFSSREF